jgi:hypothetical protein
LATCGGGKSGSNGQIAPTAVITPIGYKPTSSNPVAITARAGADVALSGKYSDGGNISIVDFTWAQTDTDPNLQVTLIYRTANTVSFTVPSTASAQTLNFKLTVTNASGDTVSSTAKVNVVPANDSNRFLEVISNDAPAHRFSVTVSTTTGLNKAVLTQDVPVCVRSSPTLAYKSRDGLRSTFALPVQSVDAKWLASVGGTAGFPNPDQLFKATSSSNPTVSFDLPVVNEELLLPTFNRKGASVAQVAAQLVPGDIDAAYVAMVLSATPGSCDGLQPGTALGGSQLVLQMEDEDGRIVGQSAPGPVGGSVSVSTSDAVYQYMACVSGKAVPPQYGISCNSVARMATAYPNGLPTMPLPDASGNLSPDDIRRASAAWDAAGIFSDFISESSVLPLAPTAIETRESAIAYYNSVDPAGTRNSLAAWLRANSTDLDPVSGVAKHCFDASAADYGASSSAYNVVHSTYTNNYDLGFGRDMYFAACADGTMASIVMNYPSLEDAANRVGGFLAVAMEYSPPAGSSAACFSNPVDPTTNTGSCSAKFFAYALDDRTGQYPRVLSANFDRRGQKFLPGACTVCHGGLPRFAPGQQYPGAYGYASAGTPGVGHGGTPPRSVSGASGLVDAGDVDSTFMPWDVGSLLFSDTDPAFDCAAHATAPSCASIHPSDFTRAAQEPSIKRLNALAWRTYLDREMISGFAITDVPGPIVAERYDAPLNLLAHWYTRDAGCGVYPNASKLCSGVKAANWPSSWGAFDDSGVPPLWDDGAGPSGSSAKVYQNVFAHECRSCHIQGSDPHLQFESLLGFVRQMTDSKHTISRSIYEVAQMPLSRLTTDRMWADFGGGVAPVQALTDYMVLKDDAYFMGIAPELISISRPAADFPGSPVFPRDPFLDNRTPFRILGQNGSDMSLVTISLGTSGFPAGHNLAFGDSFSWVVCTANPGPSATACAQPGDVVNTVGTPMSPGGGDSGILQSGTLFPGVLLDSTVNTPLWFIVTIKSPISGAMPVTQVIQDTPFLCVYNTVGCLY